MAFAERGRLVYQDEDGLIDLPLPRLSGAHQVENAGLAVAILRAAGIGVGDKAIEAGLADRRLAGAPAAAALGPAGRRGPARLRRLARRRPQSRRPGRRSRRRWRNSRSATRGRSCSSAGMLTTKEPDGYFRPFAGLARRVMTVPVPGSDAGFDPETLAAIAMEANVPAAPFKTVRAALDWLRADFAEEPVAPRILIGGSLYLAGDVLRENGPLPE